MVDSKGRNLIFILLTSRAGSALATLQQTDTPEGQDGLRI